MARKIKDYLSKYYWHKKIRKIHNKFRKQSRDDIALYNIYEKFIKETGLSSGNINTAFIDDNLLNTNSDDESIKDVILRHYKIHNKKFLQYTPKKNDAKSLGICFTELYAVGGHTPLVERIAESFAQEYDVTLFATRVNFTACDTSNNVYYATKADNITSKIKIDGVNWDWSVNDICSCVRTFYNKIVQSGVNVLFCYIHPHDIVLSATLALIKEYTKIKVIYFNLADHFYNLGYKFAHLIIDARPAGQRITREIRGYNNTALMPLQQKRKEETFYYSQNELQKLREKIGINDGDYFTLTGSTSYKLFEEDGSVYFQFIKDLLQAEPKLKHIVMSEFSAKYRKMIDNIFNGKKDLRSRLIIIDRVANFDIYMQACDLFIDTFPQGGALIHLDMMRNKKPTVVKINKTNPIRSFEFYLPKNYQYMYEDIENMKNGILELLYSKDKQREISDVLYQYYLDTYEFSIVKEKYKILIENSDNLEQFYGRSFY